MNLSEWANSLPNDEKAYVSQCFKFWQGHNGNREPYPPNGISNARAEILKYHTKSFLEPGTRRRKMEDLKVISFRATEEFEKEIAFDSAKLDVNKSIFLRACIEAGRPFVLANPRIINFFSDSVIPK